MTHFSLAGLETPIYANNFRISAELLINETSAGQCTAIPCEKAIDVSFYPSGNAIAQWKVTFVDIHDENRAGTVDSNSFFFKINNPADKSPTILSPADGTDLPGPVNVVIGFEDISTRPNQIVVHLTDSKGAVHDLGSVFQPPYQVALDPTKFMMGPAVLTASAFLSIDNGTIETWSRPIRINIKDITPPTIFIAEPVNGQTYGSQIYLRGQVWDNINTINSATATINPGLVIPLVVNNRQFSIPLPNFPSGAYTLVVTASDDAGNQGTSSVSYMIRKLEPKVVIVSPRATAGYPSVPATGFNFTGTAESPLGVAQVSVSIWDYVRSAYTVVNAPAVYDPSTKAWSFSVLPTMMTSGGQLLLKVKAVDGQNHFVVLNQVVTVDGIPPLLVSAVSRKTHGETKVFDINLDLVTDYYQASVEDRVGGPTQIELKFSEPIKIVGRDTSAVSLLDMFGKPKGTLTQISVVENMIRLTMKGLNDAFFAKVNLNKKNITDIAGNPLGGINTVFILPLIGDVNWDGRVDAVDIQRITKDLTQYVTNADFRSDLNANGVVDKDDLKLVVSQSKKNFNLKANPSPIPSPVPTRLPQAD